MARDQLSKSRENAFGCSFNWAMLISPALLKGADLVWFPPIRSAVLGLFHLQDLEDSSPGSPGCVSHYLQEQRCWNYNQQLPWRPVVGTKQPGAFLPQSPQLRRFKAQSSVCKRPCGCCHAKATPTFHVLSA